MSARCNVTVTRKTIWGGEYDDACGRRVPCPAHGATCQLVVPGPFYGERRRCDKPMPCAVKGHEHSRVYSLLKQPQPQTVPHSPCILSERERAVSGRQRCVKHVPPCPSIDACATRWPAADLCKVRVGKTIFHVTHNEAAIVDCGHTLPCPAHAHLPGQEAVLAFRKCHALLAEIDKANVGLAKAMASISEAMKEKITQEFEGRRTMHKVTITDTIAQRAAKYHEKHGSPAHCSASPRREYFKGLLEHALAEPPIFSPGDFVVILEPGYGNTVYLVTGRSPSGSFEAVNPSTRSVDAWNQSRLRAATEAEKAAFLAGWVERAS